MDTIESVILQNVYVQSNGIIRNSKGRLIGRLVDSVDYTSEHINMTNEPEWDRREMEKKFASTYRSSTSYLRGFEDGKREERGKVIQECIDLSDRIELEEPDGGTKEWMAFKRFRNTLRDRLS